MPGGGAGELTDRTAPDQALNLGLLYLFLLVAPLLLLSVLSLPPRVFLLNQIRNVSQCE